MHVPTVRRRVSAIAAAVAATIAAISVPAAASGHPLGNFTINHYAGLRVGAEAIQLDLVVDLAEIPAFQERLRIDVDGDGDVTDAEAEAARADECRAFLPSLELTLGGARLDLRLDAAGLSFPAGAGGVPTMRIVCELSAALVAAPAAGTVATFADASFPDRLGWREIVVIGDGLSIGAVDGEPAPTGEGISARLTLYPTALLAQPLDVRSVTFVVTGSGPDAPGFTAPDAAPIGLAPNPTSAPPAASPADRDVAAPVATPVATPTATESPAAAAIPGGVGGDIPDVFQVADLTPFLAAGSIALAIALGAGHALTPGHGKTLMAAYLVGSRGTVRHALALGLSVTISHTVGILVLAVLVTSTESALPPDIVVRVVPIVAAIAFVVIGAWMVAGEVRRRRAASSSPVGLATVARPARDAGADHEHGQGHDQGHDRGPRGEHLVTSPGTEAVAGGRGHTHAPAGNQTLSWRNLFALGLAGGIIPSTSALIILLGAVVTGRAAFGVVLVVAFGLGMAVVLGGVGAAMVVARERLERLSASTRFGRLMANAPLIASIAVLGIGLWLTARAVSGGPVL